MEMNNNLMTTHLASIAMLEGDLEKGAIHCYLGRTGDDEPAKLEIGRHYKHGITAQIFVGKNDQHPTTITGLTIEQADALGWAFVKLC